ncbi:DUF2642 domain-containing protein [Lentibacillus sp. Marseille-P4043]|uniref:DUF2642 domain-containing protein n=1 Tax=Lentibacillus sp. Marseille-P4043 TaxID=2040293 RepID=UPI000D0BB765|nr:DUF2642 domain-containing protein [Lentibacillus sp. Marseille-P4043]
MALTDRQTNLLRYLNQLSQNIASSSGVSNDFSLDLPGLDVDFNIGVGNGDTDGGTETPPPTTPGTPNTLRDVLLDLVNETVQVTTPFGMVTGTLIAVRDDYIAIIETTGDQVLVRMEKVEFVSEI